MNIKEWVQDHKHEMISTLSDLIAFPTVESHDSKHPFGQANADCLDYALEQCAAHGMRTQNLDYYAGYAEIGTGDFLFGILGHLDVVPAGAGWTNQPFKAEIRDGKIIGRGAADDKGPMVSAIYAVKYLNEKYPNLDKRIRLIFGCNEESGFKCIQHYVACEGHIDLGFTPDGPFPCCFGEKGIIHFTLSTKDHGLESVKGGLAVNAVPDYVELKIKKDNLDLQTLKNHLHDMVNNYSVVEEDGIVQVVVHGVAAHASTPEKGVNAIANALTALVKSGCQLPWMKEYVKLIGLNMHGEQCNAGFEDQYGKLTMSSGIIKIEGDELKINVDVRAPFTIDNNKVIDTIKAEFSSLTFTLDGEKEGIYFPEDSSLVSTLVGIYNKVTGENAPAVTMGGGTYARGINNCIAFGPDKLAVDRRMHNADEFVSVHDFLEATEIYVMAIEQLLGLAKHI
jgi:succinyl-diaminopimelate desuccinylase